MTAAGTDGDATPGHAPDAAHAGRRLRPGGYDVPVDCTDPRWPLIPQVSSTLPWATTALRETRALFAVREATWDVRFGDDLPADADAVREE